MQSNTLRSVTLALLMIASVMVPLADINSEPPEMMEDRVALEAPPVPCLGNDACRGTDAGNTYATAIDISNDFDWNGANETNTYWGTMTATSYSSTSDNNNDMFIVDTPAGYGVMATISWNGTGAGTYDNRAYRIAMGGTSMLGWGTGTYSYGYAWAYCYDYSTSSYEIMMSTSGDSQCTNGPYTASSSYAHANPFPADLAGDPMMVLVNCYYCYYYTSNLEYQLDVTVYPADGGVPGDATQDITSVILDMPDEPFSWSYQTDTFTLDGTTTVNVEITSCDYWCSSESTMDITKPDGTVDSTGYWASGYTGTVATYSAAGTYTIEKMDSWGDGGFGVQVGAVLGSFTGILTGDAFNLVDKGSGTVDSSDTSDTWALVIPEGYQSNITLEWEQSADLDLYVFANSDETGMIDYSWSSTPGEFIDLGGAYTNTTVYVKVDYYYWGSSSSWAGYLLTAQLTPSVAPPCFEQNDAGSGDDAANDDTSDPDASPMDLTSMGGNGTIQGMVCDGYDDEDWYEFTLPAYHGLWARLDWSEDEGSEHLMFYQYMDIGYASTLSTSTSSYFNPQAVSSNESYSFSSRLDEISVVWLRVVVSSLPEDVELNYTIEWSIYNASQEPVESVTKTMQD